MPSRSTVGNDYRFGFNGQEKDDEIYGEGKSLSFEFRNYDSRIGRFWSVDPLVGSYPWNSPYAFAENTPIWARELEGLEAWYTTNEDGNMNETPIAQGPLDLDYVKDLGATHVGVMTDRIEYSFSQAEIDNFSNWNAQQGASEPGACLGCAITGSEILTGADAGFRNSKGRNVLSGKTLYDLGNNLASKGFATELPTSQGKETETIINNPNSVEIGYSVYTAGPAGAWHSLIITHQGKENIFSIFDQGTGWDDKNVSQQGAQTKIDAINSFHPTWGSRIWQLNKRVREEVISPLK